MIKATDERDKNKVLSYLCKSSELDKKNVAFSLEKSDTVLVYENDLHIISGCGTFRLWGENKSKADIYVYISPSERISGAGGKLLDALTDISKKYSPDFINTRVETKQVSSLSFFHNRGYKSWYTELILYHSGEEQPKCDPGFINYSDDFFMQYIDALRKSFYELRSENDFQPYYCCEATDDKRKELIENKNNIYILPDKGNVSASVVVNGDVIEDVFVAEAYRGQGLGRKTICFAINKAIEQGSRHITLDAIEWNKRALHLYESVGFKIAKAITYLRYNNE